MQLSTESLARAAGRRPWRTLAVWVVALITAGVLSSQLLGGALTTESEFTNNPESKQAASLLEQHFAAPESNTEFVVVRAEVPVDDPTYQSYVSDLQTAVADLGPDVVQHTGSYLTGDGPVSESGLAALLPVRLAGTDHDVVTDNAAQVVDTVAGVEAPAGFEAYVAGPATLENEFIHLAEEGLRQGESIGLAVALVVLVFVFGAVVAGLIPIVLAVMAIAISLGAAALVGQVMDLSFFITNIVTMIGLAVGIDYSLFIVSRYREERSAGRSQLDAITHAGATASKAVLFSGLTVVLALAGMLLIPDTGFRSIGLGAILVVLIAVAASLTLLPAVLALMGDRINAGRIRGRGRRSADRGGRFWDRITGTVVRRPVVSLILSAGLLIVAALPFFSMTTGFSGVSTLPDEVASKQAFTIMEAEFSGGLGSPVEIVVDAPAVRVADAVDELASMLTADPAFGPASVQVSADGAVTRISAPLAGDIVAGAALDTVRELRAEIVPEVFTETGASVVVGGITATNLDILDQQARFTPIVFGFVLGLSFILLTVAFRSLIVPAKAILMNLLSVGAAYGLIALFFQEGVGPQVFKDIAGRLGFGQVEAIEAFLPLFLFTILFGLSMDYHVFLLSRIRERFDHTGDNTESVAYGLRTTGALITGAAAIVRSVLVPATMKLLGDRNWYLPSWLRWLPEIHIEGPPERVERVEEFVRAA